MRNHDMTEVGGQRARRRRILGSTALALSLGCAMLAPGQARAQETPPPPAAEEEAQQSTSGGVNDIIVTARRRAENLQDTPIAITAFGGDALAELQVVNVAEVGRFTPNVSMEPVANISGSSASITTFIRGVGQTDFNITIDPGVGIYYDGVYVARMAGALLDLGDIESIQILRGPQGTLFGKNTIGGAVLITPNAPSDELEGSVELTAGEFNRLDARAMLNLPLADGLAVRVSGGIQTRDGYVRRLLDGGMQGNRNSVGARIALRGEITDNLTATLAFDVNRRREQSAAQTLVRISEGILPGVGGFQSFLFNKVLQAPQCGPPGVPAPVTNPNCFTSRWLTNDIDETWAGARNNSDFDLWGTNLTLEWDVGPFEIKSITAYRDMEAHFTFDFDGTPLPIAASTNNITQDQLSQELQFTGTLFNDRLNWTAGLFYLRETAVDHNELAFAFSDFISGGDIENESYAAYTQFTFDITDRLSITPGLRYTDETKTFDPSRQRILVDRTGGLLLMLSRCFVSRTPVIPPNPFCVPDPLYNPQGDQILPAVPFTTEAQELTPSLSIDYDFTDDILGYASYSRGFKSGGFSQRILPPEPAAPAFDPEFVESYEVGLKTRLFDRRLRLNVAGFYMDYTNLQIVVNEGIAPKVRNAGTARIQGVELEAEAVLTNWLRLSGGVGYIDAQYTQLSPTAAPVNLNSRFPNVPEWTASAAASIDFMNNENGTLTLHGDWSYRSSHFKDAVNSPDLFQPGYHVFGASLTYRDPGENFWLTGGVTNIGDERYLLGGYQDLAQASAVTANYSRPREWFLTAGYRF